MKEKREQKNKTKISASIKNYVSKNKRKIIKRGLVVLVLLMLILAIFFEKMEIQVPIYYRWLLLFFIVLSPFVGFDSKKRNNQLKPPEKDIIYSLINPAEFNEQRTEIRKELESAAKNSFEVIEKVKKLQPEIDRLIELEYIKSVERSLDNISERKESLKETIELYRKEPFRIPEYLIKELKEIEFAENLSGEEKKKYIIKKAHKEMTMFGSCHGIWALQKKILKEKYNIDWLTPSEEHPEIMFD